MTSHMAISAALGPSFSAFALMTRARMSRRTTRDCWTTCATAERCWCSTTPRRATSTAGITRLIRRSSAATASRSSKRQSRFSIRTAPVFHYPNQIAAHDFDGWVQERGLYFMDQWDPHFTPLLASNDPGEQPQKGGLAAGAVWQGLLHLHRLCILPPVALRRARRHSSLCESAERGT